MDRKIIKPLSDWFTQENRKPLIIRGARQVGKTWVIRQLASQLNLDLIELNLERDPNLKTLFQDNDPQKTILRLESFFNKNIISNQTLLFIDEIQAAPELLAKLRWFAEEKPEMAIIATGSLLDFTLNHHEFSMPVGRVSYMYLEPLSFEEFLLALNQHKLCQFLSHFELHDTIPQSIHERLWQLLREYIFIGGMPAAVNSWVQTKSLLTVNELHQNMIQTYRDDFSKYSKRIPIERLDDIFRITPSLLGKKFKYSAANKEVRLESLKNALNLLCQARICHKVFCSSANGIPLGADLKETLFKVIFLDIGLVSATMGLSLSKLDSSRAIQLVNEGGIAEQLVGQLLRAATPCYMDPKLYYWANEKQGSESEIDYLIQSDATIIPIEVKAGTTGTLRSLHTLMNTKHLKKAVRFNADYPNLTDVKVKDHQGKPIEYELMSLPLYLVEQVYRLQS